MTTVITFDLGTNPATKTAPTLPEPLDQSVFHTRQEIRDYQNAIEAYYNHQREIERQARIAIDNQRAKDLAESQRELTDAEYDAAKLKQWTEQKEKEAARLTKEKADAIEKTAYMLSSPPVAEVFCRSEFVALQEIIHWASRNYTLPDTGFLSFGQGIFHVQMMAPATTKKGGAK